VRAASGSADCGAGVERAVEQVEQLAHRRSAGRHGVGGSGDEHRQLVRQAINRRVERQALVHGEHRLALGQVAGGGLPGQQEEGEGPEGEHVQGRAVGVLDAEGLGRQVDLLGGIEAFGQVRAERRSARVGGMACEARSELSDARLPVPDDEPRQATGAAGRADEHAPRGEGPMGHLPGMGVGDRLAELAHQLDAGIEAETIETSWSPQIQPLLTVDPLEEQGGTPFRLHQIERLRNAVVAEVLNHPELAFGLAAEALLLLGGRGGAGQVDAHPAGRADPGAGGGEVLPAGPLVEEIAELPVAGPAAPVRRAEPSLVESLGEPG
jgi:hypothetical protein